MSCVFAYVDPLLGACLGGLMLGFGLLALFRHRSSAGGIGILAVYLQDRFGWRAGLTQLCVDLVVLVTAFAAVRRRRRLFGPRRAGAQPLPRDQPPHGPLSRGLTPLAKAVGALPPKGDSAAPHTAPRLPGFDLPEPFLRWFADKGWSPRPHQLDLLQRAENGASVLLIAPTGRGKTLAGFLPALVDLARRRKRRPGTRPPGIHTLYISP